MVGVVPMKDRCFRWFLSLPFHHKFKWRIASRKTLLAVNTVEEFLVDPVFGRREQEKK